MKLFIYLVLVSLFSQLTGCAHYYAARSNFNDKISEWLKENEYTKIESSLEKLSPQHQNYKKISSRKNNIANKKAAYINNILQTAKNFQNKEQWQAAIDTYNSALSKIKNNTQLIKAKNKLLTERDMQVTELRKNMLLRRSRALLQYQPIYIKLKKLIPNDHRAQYDIYKFENEINETSRLLANCGKQAFDKKNYTLAEECYDLSVKLVASKKIEKLKNNVKNIIKHDNEIKTAHDLISAYHSAYESGNFPKARLHLDQLLAINPEHKQTQQLKEQLDRDINTRIEKGINIGKTQYSEGKINIALKTWQELSKLDPKNEELSALISRAQKVSSKIEKLEKSPGN